jgi:hypothetical protein
MDVAAREETMFDAHDAQRCDFCKMGQVVNHNQPVAFRQRINGSYIFCEATLPLGVCDLCGSSHWNEDAEAIIADVVRLETNKLLSGQVIASA